MPCQASLFSFSPFCDLFAIFFSFLQFVTFCILQDMSPLLSALRSLTVGISIFLRNRKLLRFFASNFTTSHHLHSILSSSKTFVNSWDNHSLIRSIASRSISEENPAAMAANSSTKVAFNLCCFSISLLAALLVYYPPSPTFRRRLFLKFQP